MSKRSRFLKTDCPIATYPSMRLDGTPCSLIASCGIGLTSTSLGDSGRTALFVIAATLSVVTVRSALRVTRARFLFNDGQHEWWEPLPFPNDR